MPDCSCSNFPASLGNVTFGASVGIGTASPAAALDVRGGRLTQSGSAAVTGYLETNSGMLASTTALNPGLLVFGGDGTNALYGMDLGYNGGYRLRFMTGGTVTDFAFGYHSVGNPTQQGQFTELVTIKGSGKVGIGTTDPLFPLDVVAGAGAGIRVQGGAGDNATATMYLGRSTAAGQNQFLSFNNGAAYDFLIGRLVDSDDLVFGPYPGGGVINEHMRLTTGGRLGIGTSSPAYTLDVAGATRTTGAYVAGGRTVADGDGCYYA